MLSDQGVDPTSLLWRSEGEVMAMQCNFHSPQSVGFTNKKVKVKRSRYRPNMAQRVGRRIALLFHDRGTRRG